MKNLNDQPIIPMDLPTFDEDGREITEFIVLGVEAPPDDWEPPSYSEVGRILVRVDLDATNEYDDKYEVIDHDGCTFWINEGVGFEWWLENEVGATAFPRSGLYLITNVVGSYYKGTWGFDDDDESWTFNPPRRLTLIERFKRWWFKRELP